MAFAMQRYGYTIVNVHPYANEHYNGRVEVVCKEVPSGSPPDITIQTDRLTLRPITSYTGGAPEHAYPFYEGLLGNKEVVEELGDGRVRTEQEVRAAVNRYIKRWMEGDFFSAFVVYTTGSREPMAHTVLDHGGVDGRSRFEILMQKESIGEYRVWNHDVHKEITYAMFMGWLPHLVKAGALVINDTDDSPHPLRTVTALGHLKENTTDICVIEEKVVSVLVEGVLKTKKEKVVTVIEKRVSKTGNFAYQTFDRIAKDPVFGKKKPHSQEADKREYRFFKFPVTGLIALQSKFMQKKADDWLNALLIVARAQSKEANPI